MGTAGSKDKNTIHNNLIQEHNRRKLEERYTVSDQAIATGSATQIKQATSKKYTKTKRSANDNAVAIKLYDGKSEIPPDLKQEAAILSECDHPNIVKLYETQKVGKSLSLVMELCSGGTLRSRMPYKEESRIAQIIYQVCSAITYLHQKNIVHRDIELDNILFETPADDSDIKIIDFGCATFLDLVPNHPGAFKFLKEKTGHVQTMAPEVIKGKYGPKCDVWSVGITTYMLLKDGEPPFTGTRVDDIERKILQGAISYSNWKHSSEAKEFVQHTAMVSSAVRLSSANALKHAWLVNNMKPKKDKDGKKPHKEYRLGNSEKLIPNELVMSFELYRMAPPLKRVALNALARKSTSSKYRDLFREFDTTGSGTLTKQEFMDGLKFSGDSEEELNELFTDLDINCNGEILYTEFIAATLEADGELEDAALREAFDLIDTDHTGYITRKNVKKMLGNDSMVKETTIDQIMLKGKSKVSFEDFSQMFEHSFSQGGGGRGINPIAEFSLNEEQLSHLKKDELDKHMAAVREENE